MSDYDVLKRDYGDASAEEKLVVIRLEMRIPIDVIRGYARLLKEDPSNSSGDFDKCVNGIAEAAETLKAVLDALTID
ncbi:MAG: hypothetical protein GY797_04325 [Deltaproteobacteria bacterium]|nr:hypothetical protein [Deltaproteobacteria bacterium]